MLQHFINCFGSKIDDLINLLKIVSVLAPAQKLKLKFFEIEFKIGLVFYKFFMRNFFDID